MQTAFGLLMAKLWSVRGASRQPAFMGSSLTICQTSLPWIHLVDVCGSSPGLDNGNQQTVKFGTQL